MRKILIVARREYLAAVRTKAFLIGLLSMPVMMFGSILVQMMLKDQVDLADKRFAVVDRTPGRRASRPCSRPRPKRGTRRRSTTRRRRRRPRPSSSSRRSPLRADARGDGRAAVRALGAGPQEGARRLPRDRPRRPEAARRRAAGPRPAGPAPQAARGREAIRYQTNTPARRRLPRLGRDDRQRPRPMQQRSGAAKVSLKALTSTRCMPVPLVTKKLSKKDPQTGRRSPTRPTRAAPRRSCAGRAGDPDVHDDPGRHDAADAERLRGEDAADRRGAARLGPAVRADDGQAARAWSACR